MGKVPFKWEIKAACTHLAVSPSSPTEPFYDMLDYTKESLQ
jgi:hypothetical protein